VATQNPIEQEGTYPLPEAQLDRFMMEIRISYPTPSHEEEIVLRTTSGVLDLPAAVFDGQTFLSLCELVWSVPVPKHIAAYAVRLCGASRPESPDANEFAKSYVSWGAGPRGSQNLVLAAKAHALLSGRTAPTADDVRKVALPVLRHRILVNHRAIGDAVTSDAVVAKLLVDTTT
jgi:MoxR-like ATPase